MTPKQTEYRILPGMRVLDLRTGPRKAKERLPVKLVTGAYNRFVAGYYKRKEPLRALFISHSIPWLVRNTTPDVARILAAVWFRRHGKGRYGPFMGEVHRAVNVAARPQNPLSIRLRKRQHRDALAIVTHLASLSGGQPFYLPVRELQLRMLLPHPETARRLIQRLVKYGAIALCEPGISRPVAAKLGLKAQAATYRLC